MSKLLVLILLSAGIASAHATNQGNNGDKPINNTNLNAPVATATGGTAVAGAAALATAVGHAAATSGTVDNSSRNNSNVLGSTSQGGAGGSSNSVSNGTGGDSSTSVMVERSAPSIAVSAPAALMYDCRRTIGGGASSPGGSGVVSGIPLWKEFDCTVMMAVSVATRENGFTVQDRRELICKLDVVSESKTCKDLAESKRIATVLNDKQ